MCVERGSKMTPNNLRLSELINKIQQLDEQGLLKVNNFITELEADNFNSKLIDTGTANCKNLYVK